MGTPDPTDEAVESITVQLGELELSISVRRRGEAAGAGSASVAGNSAFDSPSSVGAPAFSPGLVRQVIAAETAADYQQISLPHLSHLLGRFRSSDQVWTPAARLARAFKAGLLAHRRLQGEIVKGAVCGIPNRNTVYIVLRSRDGGAGFWTRDYAIYHRGVFVNIRGQEVFDRESISHAFASQAEASAFISGAQVGWPPAREE